MEEARWEEGVQRWRVRTFNYGKGGKEGGREGWKEAGREER